MVIGLLIIKALYYMLPAYFANAAPVLCKKNFKFLAKPVHKSFGSHKTYRGMILAVIFGGLIFYIQQLLYNYSFFQKISLIDYSKFTIALGFLLGFGAISGDLIKSYFKRKFNIAPGKPWVPFDQLDFVIGALLFSSIIYFPSWKVILIIIIVSPFIHAAANHLAFYLKLSKTKW